MDNPASLLEHWQLFLPIGIIGAISWAVWLIRKIMSLRYRPLVNDFRTTTSVVVPSFHEDPDVLERCLDTWLSQQPTEVIVVLDLEDIEARNRLMARHDRRLHVMMFAHEGKRSALGVGIRAARYELALCGGRDVVVDGGVTDGGYAMHLDGASYWQLNGFTVRGGQKGVMLDRANGNVIENLLVEGTGDEAIHLRQHSTDNVVRGNTVRQTGLRNEKFGEGIYVGSAESNWCEHTNCQPDRSDRNVIEGNTITETTSESVDIKEGTTGGILRGNTFSGAGQSDADSWVDVKGNDWSIVGNVGTDSSEDGFQVHEILDGWGVDNTFDANTATVNAGGYAINVTKNEERNRVGCDNRSVDAGQGLSPGTCG